MTYDLRLRAYFPGTDSPLGVLPEPLSWQASVVHNNDGALTVKYSELAEGGAIAARTLNDGLDVALEWSDGTTWAEPDNCRFLKVDDSYDRTDPAKVHDLSLVSWSWLLNKVCDLNLSALAGSRSKNAGQRVFAATRDAGDVVKTLLDEHDARTGPAVPILRDSWDTSHDSGGNAWLKKLGKNAEGRAFPAGQPLHAKLDAFVKNGLCDWRTRGRALRMYNQNSASIDLSATVHLRYFDDLGDAPSKVSQADRVARLLVKGDGKHKETVLDPAVPEHYGRWEALLDSAGVKDDDDLADAGNAELSDRNRIKGEYTRTLTMAGRFMPFRDYNVGDWVTAPGADGDERLRVMQITISRDERNGLSGNIVLGDRFTAKDLALAGRVSAITGGTTGVIGNGTTVTTPQQDTRQPAAPTGLAVTDELYLNPFGEHRSRGRFSWNPVTTATDGTALEVAKYELLGQEQTTPASVWRVLAATSGNTPSLTREEFAVGSQWLFTVRAYGVTTTEPGVQSATVAHTFSVDTVAPNSPSTPTATNELGGAVIGWDGKDHFGAVMPPDFVRTELHLSTVSGFTPNVTASSTTRKAHFPAAGTVTLSGLAYGTTYYARLVAVDLSGNYSTPSAQVSFVPQRAVTDDLAQDAIDAIVSDSVEAVMPSISGKNRVTHSASAPSNYAGQIAGDTWFRYSGTTVIGMWRATSATAWAEQTIAEAWLPQVNIGSGTYGFLNGDRLAGRSVLAESLFIGDFTNQVENPGFEAGNLTGWNVSGAWGVNTTSPHGGSYRAQVAQTTGTQALISKTVVNVSEGDVWVAVGWLYADLTAGSVATVGLITDTGATAITLTPANTGGWQRYTATYTVPAGVKTIQLRVACGGNASPSGSLRVDDLYLRRANEGDLLVDGSVLANKMSSTDIFALNQRWGPAAGTHLSATPNDGFRALTYNPGAANAVQAWLRMGDADSGDGMSIGFDPDNPDARITAEGHAAFKSVSADAMRVDGLTIQQMLAAFPKGRVAYAEATASVTGISTTETAIVELRAILEPGRTYSIDVTNLAARSTVAGDQYRMNLRYALDGAAVTTASTGLRIDVTGHLPVSGTYLVQPPLTATLRTGGWGAAREVRFLFTVRQHSGSGTIDVWGSALQPLSLIVEDDGPDMAPTTTQVQRVAVWNATAMYQDGAGSSITSADVRWDGAYDDYFAHLLFNGNAVEGEAATVATVVSGATLLKAEVYLYAAKTTAGSVWIPQIRSSTATAASAASAGTIAADEWTPPAGEWVDISAIWSSASRSVHVHGGRKVAYVLGGTTYYRETRAPLLNTASHPARLRLTYLK